LISQQTRKTPGLRIACIAFWATTVVFAQHQQTAQWVALPDSTRPLAAPTLDSSPTGPTLRYGNAFAARIAPGSPEWLELTLSDGARAYLPYAYAVRKTLTPEGNLPIGAEVVDRHTPLALDYRPSDLVEIPRKWHYHANATHRLRREAAQAMGRMFEDARKEGIHLRIASAYRSPMQQRFVYLRKIEEAGFGQNLIARPGHSEHQLGTALDVTGLNPGTAMKPEFADTPEGKWIEENAVRYGFQLSYPRDSEERTGYTYEPWHIRYMGHAR